ncbi:MAG: hypothetical protein HYT80_11945 [Euryarchaeota archaeon]|nr:hypothetical protein [Euryarchaeota archaeon]
MAASDESFGGMVNRRSLPGILLGLAVLLILVSFAVGWFSVDAILHRAAYDETAPDNAGREFGTARLDLEMHMLKITTQANPIAIEEKIRERGEPTYDEHAGRMGTVMLGVLMVQFTVLLSILAVSGFYYLHRKRRGARVTLPQTGDTQMWQAEVIPRPSAGFWLTVVALGFGVTARVLAQRNGDFADETVPQPIPKLPKITSG